ncbi:hypothetical protein D1164_11940 [Mariniphaga sediminis]|uniref:Uncharacterized protein n=1 Tax=Mariniphaga sediminis TaxID=1628158 RepID=A0A399CYL3_9BACT|nr:hypothetical protein D1164_11940 [Mariniphaga sediminis]
MKQAILKISAHDISSLMKTINYTQNVSLPCQSKRILLKSFDFSRLSKFHFKALCLAKIKALFTGIKINL